MKNNSMNFPIKTTSLVCASLLATSATPVLAENKSSLIGSIRIGALFEDVDGADATAEIENFGSRLRWNGERTITDSLNGIAYAEFRLESDANNTNGSGINRTRFLWAGVDGDFGKLQWGAQYGAYYNFISSKADIAWWGSCFVGLECSRETNVLKYTGNFGGFSIAASVEATEDSDTVENEVVDEFEFSIGYNFGNFGINVGTAIFADETSIDDTGAEISTDGGTLVGLSLTGDFGLGSIALIFAGADEDFSGSADDQTQFSAAVTISDFYGVLETRDNGNGNDLLSATLGYTWNIAPSSLMYFEIQTLDDDVAGVDATTIGRATYKFDF